jgi:hypothetical protein
MKKSKLKPSDYLFVIPYTIAAILALLLVIFPYILGCIVIKKIKN